MLLDPILKLAIRDTYHDGVVFRMAEPGGAQPRLVALRVYLRFQVVENFLPSVHDAFRRKEEIQLLGVPVCPRTLCSAQGCRSGRQ